MNLGRRILVGLIATALLLGADRLGHLAALDTAAAWARLVVGMAIGTVVTLALVTPRRPA